MAVILSVPVTTKAPRMSFDFSNLSRSEIDAELQAGWDDLEAGRMIMLEDSIKNYDRRHRR
ncbi:hypothetical protein IJ103_02385 [Candidatus Saccharibacteria bacterium]|nr:hypothetical protein [Candidatus Saccharibacteria bacterium]MBQ9017067.1 hypothetical protein [Candidatus Saccharibacteria bacterium]